ncbi:FG-GAP repeat-containing protein [Candidatus Magnetobacterium bavaricum]|uniref:FG-GAP repeat-containing protein n=1 Tax=Candidatus Magnetobacterium bavaricum TaxID=29290 RepID=A0A0F3GQC5_9BACT|nr:FG-GAP repeat-containing protein [Candidatus Magnetobacterium bavaricum]
MSYGSNTFVAVNNSSASSANIGASIYRSTILTSSDGTTWTTRPFGVSNRLNGVSYVNRTFVAVGAGGAIVQSDSTVSGSYTFTVTKTGTGTGTVTSSPAGISCGSSCSASYNAGVSVTLTAVPASDSAFTGWNGACTGTNTTCTVTMTDNLNTNATFRTTTPSISVTSPQPNTVLQSGPNTISWTTNNIAANTSCKIIFYDGAWHDIATVTAGSNSYQWNVPSETALGVRLFIGCGLTGSTWMASQLVDGLSIQPGNTTSNVLTVTKAGTGTGSVTASTGNLSWSGNTGTASYNPGTSVTLTATPDSGSTFTSWSGDCSGSTSTCTVTMSAARSVTATFSAASSTGPIAYYPFNGNANDASGRGNNGVVHGATLTTDRAGNANSAYSFNGADSYIGVPDNDALTLGASPFTIATWVYFNQVDVRTPIMAHDEGYGNANKWILWYDEQGSGNVASGPALRLHVNGTGLTPTDVGYATWTPNKNRWYHVAVTRSGNTYSFYVDGTMIGTSQNSTVIPNPAAELTLGRAEAFYLNGCLDDVRLYNRALSAAEIKALNGNKRKDDFNGDGYSDILWRNTRTGDVAIWLMNGSSITAGTFVVQGVSLDWSIKAVGDFNGDGKSDILWQNTTGDVYIWLIDGTTIQTGGYAVRGISDDWTVAALGDFNGDGKTDIMWRDSNSGDIYVWLMDGTSITSGGYIIKGMIAEWVIKTVADLDGDGKSDVLWRNSKTGDIAGWLMNGLTMSSGNYIAHAIPSTWVIKAVEDFDGDGKADMIWQDTSKGDIYMWLMDGAKISGENFVIFGLPGEWQPK